MLMFNLRTVGDPDLFLLALLMGIAIYGLMGFTPMIPKRWFLPITLFNPVAGLLSLLSRFILRPTNKSPG